MLEQCSFRSWWQTHTHAHEHAHTNTGLVKRWGTLHQSFSISPYSNLSRNRLCLTLTLNHSETAVKSEWGHTFCLQFYISSPIRHLAPVNWFGAKHVSDTVCLEHTNTKHNGCLVVIMWLFVLLSCSNQMLFHNQMLFPNVSLVREKTACCAWYNHYVDRPHRQWETFFITFLFLS